MKKCVATCVYQNNQILAISVNYNGNLIQLYRYDGDNSIHYSSFSELYKAVLAILENNNFRVSSLEMFGRTWYNVQFINVLNPTYIDRFSL